MKGRKDFEAAAQEALEEAGVVGRIHKHPMGAYTYEKRIGESAEPVHVMVYMLEVVSHADDWREKDQRDQEWVSTTEAALRVQEPGLTEIIKRLDVSPRDA